MQQVHFLIKSNKRESNFVVVVKWIVIFCKNLDKHHSNTLFEQKLNLSFMSTYQLQINIYRQHFSTRSLFIDSTRKRHKIHKLFTWNLKKLSEDHRKLSFEFACATTFWKFWKKSWFFACLLDCVNGENGKKREVYIVSNRFIQNEVLRQIQVFRERFSLKRTNMNFPKTMLLLTSMQN